MSYQEMPPEVRKAQKEAEIPPELERQFVAKLEELEKKAQEFIRDASTKGPSVDQQIKKAFQQAHHESQVEILTRVLATLEMAEDLESNPDHLARGREIAGWYKGRDHCVELVKQILREIQP